MPVIYSVGHSRHPINDFISLLEKHRIEVVVDVRGQPYSRHNPQYNRDRLKIALESASIDYSWRGEFLSGRPKPKDFYGPDGQILWDKLRAWPALHRALDTLRVEVEARRAAMLCAEEDPRRCHRRFLLTPLLVERGVSVRHIRGDGRLENEETLRARESTAQMALFS